jgi:4-amino-4-deoxychorismate lyase
MSTHSYLINGDFNQTISPLDRGFAYGDGVFRTMRVQGGIPINWPLHYQKLVADCAAIGIVCPSAEVFMEDFQTLFIHDALQDEISVAKIIVTRGEGERGYATPAITFPLRVLIKSDLPKYHASYYNEGVRLTCCETCLSKQTKFAGVKHLNRLENVMARMEWRDETIFDGIMFDESNNVIECTMSNIFARFGDELLTPSLSQCGVAGITRQQILALSKPLTLSVKEATLTLEQLVLANEIVVCNSLYGAFQVSHIAENAWSPQALASNLRSIMKYD